MRQNLVEDANLKLMMNMLRGFSESRLFALVQKEMRQILRDRQLLFLLVFPPTVQLFLYGFALSPDVKDLRIAVADMSVSPSSRELISAIVENHVFNVEKSGYTPHAASKAVKQGKVDAALIIPPEFNRRLKEGLNTNVQVLLDGVDANTAGIANGYLAQIITNFSRSLQPLVNPLAGTIRTDITFLYNPGLASAWFFVPGVMGLVLTLTGSLVSSSALIREKDSGTLEQLVMTPGQLD